MFFGYVQDGARTDRRFADRYSSGSSNDSMMRGRGPYESMKYMRYRRMMCFAVAMVVLLIILLLIVGAILLALFLPRGTTVSTTEACATVTCQNGGTCRDGTCECPTGFSGLLCQTDNTVPVTAVIRLPDEAFSQSLLDPSSSDYQQLASTINDNIDSAFGLGANPDFVDARVNSFGSGSVLVFLIFRSTLPLETARARLEALFRSRLPTITIGGKRADPVYYGLVKQGSACAGQSCNGQGTCLDLSDGAATCQCSSSYYGQFCQNQVNQCSPTTCQYGGTCQQGSGSYTCQCASGYTGTNCDIVEGNCQDVTCQNGGTCVTLSQGYRCNCRSGYEGQLCEADVNECNSNPCSTGTCVDQVNSFSCTCPPGYTGTTCSEVAPGCTPTTCMNGGTCSDRGSSFVCTCADGWTGNTCSQGVNECASNPCHFGGTCVDVHNGFTCSCTEGRTGTLCLDNIQDCASDPCVNGVCTDGLNNFTCSCFRGYTGMLCEIDIDDCAGTPCMNGGTCTDALNAFTCQCAAGYTGETCTINIDDCEGDPCTNGGTCMDLVNGYSCMCATGYTGDTCNANIDDCAGNPCENGGTCVDLLNGYSCTCAAGYTDNNCATNIDDCAGDPCTNGGTCMDLVNGYSCMCAEGYTDNNCTTDIDYCSPNLCENNATCIDGITSYMCVCVPGSNGTNCENNIDECASDPCYNNATCVNEDELGMFSCTCQDNFFGDRCEETMETFPGQLILNQTFTDDLNNSTSQAYMDLVANASNALDDVLLNMPLNASVTYNGSEITSISNGSVIIRFFLRAILRAVSNALFRTARQQGRNEFDRLLILDIRSPDSRIVGRLGEVSNVFIDNAELCESRNPCMNGGTCSVSDVNGTNVFTCSDCNPGYEGEYCEIEIDECDGSPCINGNCTDLVNGYICTCTPGYTDTNCSTEINECENDPCLNGGNCTDLLNNYSCQCAPGFNGTDCSNDIDDCASSPCENGGTCVDGPNSYTCNCPTGLNGTDCENDIDECASSPCMNNGSCTEGTELGTFNCTCTPGTSGDECEVIDYCFNDPCLNGGTCMDDGNTYTCTCAAGWNGTTCEMDINDCENEPCLNGGNCTDLVNGYSCQCVAGFMDTNCSTRVPCGVPANGVNTDLVSFGVGRFGDTYNYTCLFGFESDPGSLMTVCGPDGTWSLLLPVCTVIRCVAPQEGNSTANVSIPGGVPGDTYTYTCHPGFGTNDNLTVVCELNSEGTEATWSRDPPVCTDIDDCMNITCANGGTCIDEVEGYRCECTPGWNGTNCELDIDECAATPCYGNATCTNGAEPTVFNCTCPENFSGELCDETMEMVDGELVLNQTFTDDLNDNSTQAFMDLAANVSSALDEVFRRNATNDSDVIYDGNEITGFSNGSIRVHFIIRHILRFLRRRIAAVGLRQRARDLTDRNIIEDVTRPGSSLERVVGIILIVRIADANLCVSRNPCLNEGECMLDPQDNVTLTCDCLPGFEGEFCGINTNDCVNLPCSPGGSCIDRVNGFDCECYEEKFGDLCELDRICTAIDVVLMNGSRLADVHARARSMALPNVVDVPDPEHDSFLDYYDLDDGSSGFMKVLNFFLEIYQLDEDDIMYLGDGRSKITVEGCLLIPSNATDSRRDIFQSLGYLLDLYEEFYHRIGVGTFYVEGDNRCDPNPCRENTTVDCTDAFDIFGPTCVCQAGFEGDECELEINECDVYPCQNGATCSDLFNDYECHCVDGWIGKNCSIDENDCASLPCLNGGSCFDELDGYTCQCLEGYYGSECENVNNACDEASCANGATCVDFVFYYTCNCTESFKGPNCTVAEDTRDCSDELCANNAMCFDHPVDGFYCQCPQGWTGDFCDTSIDDCEGVSCSDRGECIDSLNAYSCQCELGYEGTDCEQEIDDCLGVDCGNGECMDGMNTFSCHCYPGWTSEFCDTDVDECSSTPCQNGGMCNDETNGFFCDCAFGWTGEICLAMYDPCIEEQPCGIRGTCDFISAGDYSCTCEEGYDGENCTLEVSRIPVDIILDVLLDGLPDNFSAQAIDDLSRQILGTPYEEILCGITFTEVRPIHRLPPSNSSNSTMGNMTRSPHPVNGTAFAIEFCYHAIPSEYRPMSDLSDFFRLLDFLFGVPILDVSLSDFNECDRDPCLNNQTCYDGIDFYFCACSPPFRGRNCEVEDHCFGVTCSYNGYCQETRDDFVCECFDGYSGQFCEERVECVYLRLILSNGTNTLDQVRSAVMSINATTVTEQLSDEFTQFLDFYQEFNESDPHERILEFLINDVQWNEERAYEADEGLVVIKGEACLPIDPEVDIMYPVIIESLGYLVHFFEDFLADFGIETILVDGDDGCQPNPCQYGGSCYPYNGTLRNYFCHCPRGLRGVDCEMNIDECAEYNPCENGGNCTDVFGSFNCSCPEGWTGHTCSVETNACKSQPCSNGANCENDGDGFTCECTPGYSGPTCSEEADACNSSSTPCNNNGICINRISYFTCNCTDPYVGATCNDTSDGENCTESLCGEGGTCVFNATTMTRTCVCDPGWTGVYCEENIDDCEYQQVCGLDVCNDRGECFDLHLGYSCQCDPGYIGPTCQINVDDCEGIDCQNGGYCMDGENSFYCQCPEGWEGRFCEEDVDECEEMPCQNGGQCSETEIGGFYCTCRHGWEGEKCEEAVDLCVRENPCRNGGYCNFTAPGNYSCDCIQDFEGSNCEIGTYMIYGILVYGSFPDFHIGPPPGYSNLTMGNHTMGNLTMRNLTMGNLTIRNLTMGNLTMRNMTMGNLTLRTLSELLETFRIYGLDHKFCGVTFDNFTEVNNGYTRVLVEFCYRASDGDFRPTSDISLALSIIQFSVGLIDFNIFVDACQYKGCMNGSSCKSFGDFAYCMCSPGFYGDRCERNYCEFDICQNGGTCSPTPFGCSCPQGFVGNYCEYTVITVQIDTTLNGDCAVYPPVFIDWLLNETRGPIFGYGLYGELNNISLASVSAHNETSVTITLDVQTFIYPYWITVYESFNRDFDVDLEAVILSETYSLTPPEGVICSADFASSRGVEICDRNQFPITGYTPSERCSGTLECVPFGNDEMGCDPQDMIRLGADDCHVLMSPGYPDSYAPNLVHTTLFEAPEDHYIELRVRRDDINLRPGDFIVATDGPDDMNPFFAISEGSVNSMPTRINTLRGRIFVSFVSLWNPDIDLSGNYSWIIHVTVKPVVATYYNVPPFRYQAVNIPEEKGSYDEDVTTVAIFSTLPGFNLLLCTDFTHTFIDVGDTAVVGVTSSISFFTVVGIFDPSGENPGPLPSTIYTLLDTDGAIASRDKNTRYSGQVFSIPESADPSDVCPERFMTDCELTPCLEYLPPSPISIDEPSTPYICRQSGQGPTCESLDADPEEYIFVQDGANVTITSPGYPESYPANTYMLLTISTVEGNSIQFQYEAENVRLQKGDVILIGQGASFNSSRILQVLDRSVLVNQSGSQTVGRWDWNGPLFFLFISSPEGVDRNEPPYSFAIEIRSYVAED